MNARRLLPFALAVAGLPASASAGVFLNEPADPPTTVTHAGNYNGTGGERVVNVCLDPSFPSVQGDPTQATENAVAEFNRFQATLGNVVSAGSVGASGIDYESILLHEMGHCLGLDHNVLGPTEVGCTVGGSCVNNTALFFTNSSRGPNAAFNTDDGADNSRGTGDDVRLDDVNRHWFAVGVNDPFAEQATADRVTHTPLTVGTLPVGDFFAEAATSFGPCVQGTAVSNTSGANGQPATAAIMFPILCINNVVRDLSPDDRTTLRIARAGNDGTAGNADDYTVRLNFQGTTTAGCNIRIRFTGGGFQCAVSLSSTGVNDWRVTDGTINLVAAPPGVNWFFNQNDTTGGGADPNCLFGNGFETAGSNCD